MVALQLPVFLTTGFLEAVNEDVVANQPEWRSKDAVMDLTAGVALLIADHASFPTVRGMYSEDAAKLLKPNFSGLRCCLFVKLLASIASSPHSRNNHFPQI